MMKGRVLNTLAGVSLLWSLVAHAEAGMGMGSEFESPLQRLTRTKLSCAADIGASKAGECADNMGEESGNCKCPDLRAYDTQPHLCVFTRTAQAHAKQC